MTPKEKAQELIDKFEKETEHQDSHWDTFEVSKQCAIICVDEIIEYLPRKKTNTHLWYWKEVKQEIKKL